MIHYFVLGLFGININTMVSVILEIHENWSPKNDDDFTVQYYQKINVQTKLSLLVSSLDDLN